jgi:hypothetical protein
LGVIIEVVCGPALVGIGGALQGPPGGS